MFKRQKHERGDDNHSSSNSEDDEDDMSISTERSFSENMTLNKSVDSLSSLHHDSSFPLVRYTFI